MRVKHIVVQYATISVEPLFRFQNLPQFSFQSQMARWIVDQQELASGIHYCHAGLLHGKYSGAAAFRYVWYLGMWPRQFPRSHMDSGGFPGVSEINRDGKDLPFGWWPNDILHSYPGPLIKMKLRDCCIQRLLGLLTRKSRFENSLLSSSGSGNHLSPLEYSDSSIDAYADEGEYPHKKGAILMVTFLGFIGFAFASFYSMWRSTWARISCSGASCAFCPLYVSRIASVCS